MQGYQKVQSTLMSGPVIEISLDVPAEGAALDAIDAAIDRTSDRTKRTRKGRVWTLVIGERTYYANVDSTDPQTMWVAAGGKSSEDYANLTKIAREICEAVGGIQGDPEK